MRRSRDRRGGGGSVQTPPPPSRWWKIQRPIRARVKGNSSPPKMLTLISTLQFFIVSPNINIYVILCFILFTAVYQSDVHSCLYMPVPIAQSGERWTAELAGSEARFEQLRRSLLTPDSDCLRSVAAVAPKAS